MKYLKTYESIDNSCYQEVVRDILSDMIDDGFSYTIRNRDGILGVNISKPIGEKVSDPHEFEQGYYNFNEIKPYILEFISQIKSHGYSFSKCRSQADNYLKDKPWGSIREIGKYEPMTYFQIQFKKDESTNESQIKEYFNIKEVVRDSLTDITDNEFKYDLVNGFDIIKLSIEKKDSNRHFSFYDIKPSILELISQMEGNGYSFYRYQIGNEYNRAYKNWNRAIKNILHDSVTKSDINTYFQIEFRKDESTNESHTDRKGSIYNTFSLDEIHDIGNILLDLSDDGFNYDLNYLIGGTGWTNKINTSSRSTSSISFDISLNEQLNKSDTPEYLDKFYNSIKNVIARLESYLKDNQIDYNLFVKPKASSRNKVSNLDNLMNKFKEDGGILQIFMFKRN